jgi:hypothetical protein
VGRGTNELWHFGPAIFYNGTGSMGGTFTDQNGCKYPAPITIVNANVTMSTQSAGAVTVTYTVPALASSAAGCPNYGANSGTFSVPVSVRGSVMQSLAGSIGAVSATVSGGVVSGTVGFQETGALGSGTFSWTESGSFSTVAVPETVPNFVGSSLGATVAAIADAGLRIGSVTYQSSDTVAAGDVISQTPAAVSTVVTGSDVALVVSTGAVLGTPIAVAIAPSAVLGYASVTLNGSFSSDASATIKTFAWRQTSGPTVSLNGATTSVATFVAPQVSTPTPISFVLTVTDTTGAASSAGTTLTVVPAAAAQLAVSVISAELLQPDSTSAHTQFDRIQGSPLAGSSLLLEVALSGFVQAPTFTLNDMNGKVLSAPTLSLVGSSANQPLVFAGPITVPSVPFTVAVSGNTGDGRQFNVTSSSAITPMAIALSFVPAEVSLVPGAAGSSMLTIFNGGSDATFTITINDPSGLLAQQPATSLQIPSQSHATVPVAVMYPASLTVIGPTLTVTVSVAGDSTRNGIATLTLWNLPP